MVGKGNVLARQREKGEGRHGCRKTKSRRRRKERKTPRVGKARRERNCKWKRESHPAWERGVQGLDSGGERGEKDCWRIPGDGRAVKALENAKGGVKVERGFRAGRRMAGEGRENGGVWCVGYPSGC